MQMLNPAVQHPNGGFVYSLEPVVLPYLYAFLAFFLWIFVLRFFQRLFLNRLRKLGTRTKTGWEEILAKAILFPARLLICVVT